MTGIHVGNKKQDARQQTEFRCWIDGDDYPVVDETGAKAKMALGLKVERFVDGKWVEYAPANEVTK